MGGGDPKTKQCLLSLQFSFHSLYCYYSIEPRQPAGEYQRGRVWGVLPASAGCMNNIFGHNGKQSIGRLICSGPRIGSNRTWLPSRPSQLGTADHSRSLEVSLLSHLCQLGTESHIPTLLKIVSHTQASWISLKAFGSGKLNVFHSTHSGMICVWTTQKYEN